MSGPSAGAFEFVAFLRDGETESVTKQFVKRQMIGAAHVQCGSIAQAIGFVERQERSPRLLLVDITGIDMPLPEIDRLADACEPGVSVVVVGEQQDVGLFRQLLNLGVADYLVKPITVDLLAQAISNDAHAAGASRGARTGKIITFAGSRGGVGTTSLATSLAWLIAERMNRRVAFIDLDLHGGGGPILLDIEVGGLGEALSHSAEVDALFLDRTMIRHSQRLFCLSAESDLDTEIKVDVEAMNTLLSALEHQFHYVVVDLPRRPGSAYRFILQRSAVQVLIGDRTLASAHNLVRMLPLVEGLGRRTLLVLNEHQQGGPSPLDREQLERSLGRGFDFVIPFDRGATDRGDNLGEPLAAGNQPFAVAVREIAADLSGQRLRRRRGWRSLIGRA